MSKTITTVREFDDHAFLVHETTTVDDHIHPPVVTHEARFGSTFDRYYPAVVDTATDLEA